MFLAFPGHPYPGKITIDIFMIDKFFHYFRSKGLWFPFVTSVIQISLNVIVYPQENFSFF